MKYLLLQDSYVNSPTYGMMNGWVGGKVEEGKKEGFCMGQIESIDSMLLRTLGQKPLLNAGRISKEPHKNWLEMITEKSTPAPYPTVK